MIKRLLIGLGVLLGLFLLVFGVAATIASGRPDDYTVTRSLEMAAPPAVAFAQVNDFHRWDAWSPWAKLDPNQKTTFGGAEAGTGATYAWDGNDDVGAGKMTIADSSPDSKVKIKLEFLRPFPSNSDITFSFEPAGTGTKVSWTMEGHNNFVSKLFGVFVSMDAMVGKDFEKGLAQMKTVAEAAAKKQADDAAAAAKAAADADAAAAAANAEADAGTAGGLGAAPAP